MILRTGSTLLALTALLCLGSPVRAQDDLSASPRKVKPTAAQAARAKAQAAKARARAKERAALEAKQVDINSATKEQLAKVPGLTPALAEQIVAHRPYLTKEHLVINKAIPEGLFFTIRQYVIARQPGAKPGPKPAAGNR